MKGDYAALLGVEPGEVARPTTVEEVAATVAQADATGKAVIPWGGGTAQNYGYLPRRADTVLDLTGLDRIVSHEPGDMTITVQAGATLEKVQEALLVHGQLLPLDPPRAEEATVGGILATNAWGPSRLGCGTARDWLIGLTVVDARGRVVKGGGKVVKNVTGYDLPKLHIGALGTLGVLVEATFKVAPRPEARVLLDYDLTPIVDGAAFASRLHKELSPALSVLRDSRARPLPGRHLFVAFTGSREAVDDAEAKAGAMARKFGIAVPSAKETAPASALADSLTGRRFVRLRSLAEDFYARHGALAAMESWGIVHTLPGTGHAEAFLPPHQDALHQDALHQDAPHQDAGIAAAKIMDWAKERRISVTLLDASISVRREGEIWWPLPPGFAWMRRLKETLDPNGTLNPGRFVGRI